MHCLGDDFVCALFWKRTMKCWEAMRRIVLITIWAAIASHAGAQTHWEFWGLLNGTHPYRLPELPDVFFDELEPYINAQTMELHYTNYHGACVTNLNKSIGREAQQFYVKWYTNDSNKPYVPGRDGYAEWLEEMLTVPSSVPATIRSVVRTNAGAHYNHTLFWQMMKKNGGGEPIGELGSAIKGQVGSFTAFKKKFTETALAQKGNGWTWLTLDEGSLKIEALPDEETPLSRGRPVLLGIDLWKHAYEGQYGTNRAAYVDAWFNVVNWKFVA
jgi:superoxide dismutase, Fe-Mn family